MDTKVEPGLLGMKPMGRLAAVFGHDTEEKGAEGQFGWKTQGD